MTTVSVCIAAWRSDTIGAAVRSIRQQTRASWEVIVVGQGEDAAVRAAVTGEAGEDPRVRLLHLSERGASRARNAAIHAAEGDLVAILDDDCEAAPDWLEVVTGILDAEPHVGTLGGAVIPPPPLRRWPRRCCAMRPSDSVYDPVSSRRTAPAGCDWIGCNFVMRRDVAARVGDFDDFLGPGTAFPAAEDVDYKLRLEDVGVLQRTTPRAVVWHTGGWRYGWRAVARNQRNYSRGLGGLAAKLTLLGDPRGRGWLEDQRARCVGDPRRNPLSLPAALRRYRHFTAAYEECLSGFHVDGRGLLARAHGGGRGSVTEAVSPAR